MCINTSMMMMGMHDAVHIVISTITDYVDQQSFFECYTGAI